MDGYKIKKLAEQASKDNSDGYPVTLEYSSRFAEKFAELIIEECIKIIEPTDHHYAFPKSYLGGADGIDQLKYKIKEIKRYFGVE